MRLQITMTTTTTTVITAVVITNKVTDNDELTKIKESKELK